MSQEAVTTLTAVEEKLRVQRAEAAAAAKEAVAQARVQGEQIISAAIAKAEAENSALLEQTREKAAQQAAEKAAEVERAKAAMRERAQARMDRVIGMIVERIVNG